MTPPHNPLQTLARPPKRSHMVHVWDDFPSLIESVALFVTAGLDLKDSVLLIATKDHAAAFSEALRQKGIDTEKLIRTGQVRFLDAEEMLAKFMVNGMPDQKAFDTVMGKVIRQAMAGSYPEVRAYGEMVNVLWQNKNLAGAIRLEQLWNQLAASYSFALLCGYFMKKFDPGIYGNALQSVCRTHTHFVPAHGHAYFDDSVQKAMHEMFGQPLGGKLADLAGKMNQNRFAGIPAAQRRVFWIKENMPLMCGEILARAQKIYRSLIHKEIAV